MSSTENGRPTHKLLLAAGQQSDDGPGLLENAGNSDSTPAATAENNQ